LVSIFLVIMSDCVSNLVLNFLGIVLNIHIMNNHNYFQIF
jgi:hypothetical protein